MMNLTVLRMRIRRQRVAVIPELGEPQALYLRECLQWMMKNVGYGYGVDAGYEKIAHWNGRDSLMFQSNCHLHH